MIDLYLVRKGNEQFWCQPEQVEYWASQGYAVYSLTPTKIAGEDAGEEESTQNVEVNIEENAQEAQEGGATERRQDE